RPVDAQVDVAPLGIVGARGARPLLAHAETADEADAPVDDDDLAMVALEGRVRQERAEDGGRAADAVQARRDVATGVVPAPRTHQHPRGGALRAPLDGGDDAVRGLARVPDVADDVDADAGVVDGVDDGGEDQAVVLELPVVARYEMCAHGLEKRDIER